MDVNGVSLFDLSASVSLDTSDFESAVSGAIDSADSLSDAIAHIDGDTDAGDGIAEIGENADESGNSVYSLTNVIQTVLGGMATIAAIKGVVSEFIELSTEIAANGDQIDKQSQVLGISREAYQEWGYILSQNGSSIESTGRLFRTLTSQIQALGEAGGKDSDFARSLKQIGLSVEEVAGMTNEEAFSAIVTGLQNMEDGANKNALALDLLGNSAVNLMPLLNGTAQSTEQLRKQAHDLGMVMSDEDVNAAVAFSDAVDNYNRSVAGLKNNLADQLLPTLTDMMNGFAEVAAFFNSGIGETLPETMDAITRSFVSGIADINATELRIDAIISQLDELANVEALSDAQIAQWDTLIGQLNSIAPELAGAFDSETHSIAVSTEELNAHKQALIDDMKTQAIAAASQARLDALAQAGANVVDLEIEAKTAQFMSDNYAQNQENNIRKVAEMLGEDFTAAFEMAIAANTDENGITDWMQVAFDSDMLSGEAFKQFGLSAEQTATAVQLVADATKSVSDYQNKATEAQKKYEAAKVDYDEQVESTEEWLTALESVVSEMDMGTTASESFGDAATTAASDAASASSKIIAALNTAGNRLKTFTREWNETKLKKLKGEVETPDTPNAGGYATGLNYVPYDEFPALLHHGEMVLNKLDAANYRKGETGNSSAELAAMANMIAAAVASRPISFGVGSRDIAVATREDNSREMAVRTAQISSGYGKGA